MTYKIYDPYAIRTHYLSLRRRPLYPSELMDQKKISFTKILLFIPPSRRNFVAHQKLCRNFISYARIAKQFLRKWLGQFRFFTRALFLLFNNQFMIFLQ